MIGDDLKNNNLPSIYIHCVSVLALCLGNTLVYHTGETARELLDESNYVVIALFLKKV